MKYIAYLRVSTDKQGRSGLGLEAQRASVAAHAQTKGCAILAEYVEVESGKNADRPQLALALAHAKREGATLLFASLDRLARNVAFIANLLESGVEIAAADMPEANRFLLHIMSAVAEQEARAVSTRTKAALAAAKARGVKLGFANPLKRDHAAAAAAKGHVTRKRKADEHASSVGPIAQHMRDGGASFGKIASSLNERGVKTASGGQWYATTVKNLLARNMLANLGSLTE